MKKSYIISSIYLLLLVIFACYSFSVIGVSRKNLERDARESQKIDDDWQVSKAVTDNFGVLLFYDEHLNDLTYSIYLNRKGLSFGYFFRSGGSDGAIMEGVRAFDSDNSIALISMNKVNVVRIECVSENIEKQGAVYTVDSGKPFSIIIPITDINMTIKMYDQDGNEIPITIISPVGM